ncbi:hypothetical protein Syun_010637 [Stephania yunnanensis]|uniref:25S rRNA (uridine-N(3))-methyltransferase BMT5-like domain-containing protein n=1 Tax=Stephania yunnanensis TaxID=152371 RepID=A0AAP0KIE9_9MAGN
MGQVLSSVLNWFLRAYQKRNPTSPRLYDPLQNTDLVITIVDDHRDQSDYWSTVVDPDHDFPNQDQNWGELVRYDGDFEGGAFDDQVSTPSTSSEEQRAHSSVDDPKEVNPLSIVVVDNGEQSTPCRGDFEELKKFVDVISRPIEEIKQEIWIKHYCSSHRILLVGEGDFSFSACLGRAFGRADNMVATSLNSQDFLKKNYGQAMSNIQSLRSRGCKVIHKVNATEMAGHMKLNAVKYDRIVYNFPHAGFSNKESVTDEKWKHKNLVSLFMANAKMMIEEKGEIHISHKCNQYLEQWGLRKLAKKNGLVVMEEVKFNLSDYPGYNTKYGFGVIRIWTATQARLISFDSKNGRVNHRKIKGAVLPHIYIHLSTVVISV